MIGDFLLTNRYGLRDQTIFYFSVKCGLRSKEISHLKWSMVMDSDGSVGDYLNLPNSSSKGNSGRIVPLNRDLKQNLEDLLLDHIQYKDFDPTTSYIVHLEQSWIFPAMVASIWRVDQGTAAPRRNLSSWCSRAWAR